MPTVAILTRTRTVAPRASPIGWSRWIVLCFSLGRCRRFLDHRLPLLLVRLFVISVSPISQSFSPFSQGSIFFYFPSEVWWAPITLGCLSRCSPNYVIKGRPLSIGRWFPDSLQEKWQRLAAACVVQWNSRSAIVRETLFQIRSFIFLKFSFSSPPLYLSCLIVQSCPFLFLMFVKCRTLNIRNCQSLN